jgi:hypothetical protein
MAFERGDTWTVVAWNEASTAQSVALALPAQLTPRTAVATSATASLSRTARPTRTKAGSWLVTLPHDTIATYVFKR